MISSEPPLAELELAGGDDQLQQLRHPLVGGRVVGRAEAQRPTPAYVMYQRGTGLRENGQGADEIQTAVHELFRG